MVRPMKKIERIIIKLVIIQFVYLIIAQWLIAHDSLQPVLNKLVIYEGVMKGQATQVIRTIDHFIRSML